MKEVLITKSKNENFTRVRVEFVDEESLHGFLQETKGKWGKPLDIEVTEEGTSPKGLHYTSAKFAGNSSKDFAELALKKFYGVEESEKENAEVPK